MGRRVHASKDELCSTGTSRSGIIMRMTSRSMSVDCVRTISRRCAICVAMELLPVPTVPPKTNKSGMSPRSNCVHTRNRFAALRPISCLMHSYVKYPRRKLEMDSVALLMS